MIDEMATPEIELWDGEGVSLVGLVNAVRQLGRKFPGLSAVKCVYSDPEHTPGSGCIIGRAVYELTGKVVDNDQWFGSVGTLNWMEALKIEGHEHNGEFYMSSYLSKATRDRVEWLKVAQRLQDDGKPWAYAVGVADGKFPEA